jgi:hypothetical protein
MKRSYRISMLLYPLRSLLNKGLRFERRPYQATIPGLMPVPKPWYLLLLLETIKTILIVSVSIVVGVVGVVIAHYTGLEH